MELRHLRHFLKVAERGSIRKAAQALNITQPTLSQSIKSLETDIGVRLFERGGSGVTLTRFGDVVHPYASRILREHDKLLDAVAASKGTSTSRLPIGVLSALSQSVHSSISTSFIASKAADVLETYLFSTNQEEMLSNLETSTWDIILTLIPDDFTCSNDFLVNRLAPSESTIYCAAEHPLANQRNVSRTDLLQFGWAVTTVDLADTILADLFIDEPVEPTIRVRSNSTNQVISAIKSTDLLCFAPDISIAPHLADGSVVKVDQSDISFSSSIALISSNLAERSQAMRKYMSLCAKHVEQELAEIRLGQVAKHDFE